MALARDLNDDALLDAYSLAVTRVVGYRVPAAALLTGAAINAITHGILDRREPLLWLAEKAGKTGYIKHATVVRKAGGEGTEYPEPVQDVSGPGTALMELDQAAGCRALGLRVAGCRQQFLVRLDGARIARVIQVGSVVGQDLCVPWRLAHGLLQELAVQLIAHVGDVPALLRAEQVTRAADFQVAHGDGEAGPHLAELLDRPQPSRGVGSDVLVRIDQQISVSTPVGTAHTTAQLVEL